MGGSRLGRPVRRLREELHGAVGADHTPREVAGSFALGLLLLGPVEGVSTTDVSLGAGPAIAVRLLVGNLILAAVASVVGYAVVHRLAVRYASTDIAETIDEAIGDLADDVLEP